jgi:hypothetical protein
MSSIVTKAKHRERERERERSVDRIPRKNGKLNVIHFTLNTSRSNKNDLFKFAL